MQSSRAAAAIPFAFVVAAGDVARAADPPGPPADFEARAAVAQDPPVGCTMLDKSFDAARTTLSYCLRLTDKTAKSIAKFRRQMTWRDAAGTNLRWTLKIVEFATLLAPGGTATRNEVHDVRRTATHSVVRNG